MTNTQKQVVRANWKSQVRFYFEGTTLTELKSFVKAAIIKENKSFQDWKARSTDEFRDLVTNKLYN